MWILCFIDIFTQHHQHLGQNNPHTFSNNSPKKRITRPDGSLSFLLCGSNNWHTALSEPYTHYSCSWWGYAWPYSSSVVNSCVHPNNLGNSVNKSPANLNIMQFYHQEVVRPVCDVSAYNHTETHLNHAKCWFWMMMNSVRDKKNIHSVVTYGYLWS